MYVWLRFCIKKTQGSEKRQNNTEDKITAIYLQPDFYNIFKNVFDSIFYYIFPLNLNSIEHCLNFPMTISSHRRQGGAEKFLSWCHICC